MPETRTERRARWEAEKQLRLRRARIGHRVGGVLLTATGLLGVTLAIHEARQGSWLATAYYGLLCITYVNWGVGLIRRSRATYDPTGLKGELLRAFREVPPPAPGDAGTGPR